MKKLPSTQNTGERLREIRRKSGKTGQETAELLGISYSHYSKAEAGFRELGRPALRLFSSAFGVDEEWLDSGKVEEGVLPVVREKQERYLPPSGKPPGKWVDAAIGELERDREFLERAAAELGVPISQLMAAIGKRIQDGKAKGAES